ncbi:HORMA domain-containing protein 2-like isoform X2 [Nymphalis io]|uniref:HORMA domain-containing protein 2-like isoform X2 n=1 Tax=Inachis io TaxID=171585 RepID=UPI002167818C|nr:HORMA domain-containing protein 2-like isoform X2 [Nymphalis io]
MTATATPTNQAVSEWVKVFPRQATENYTSSLAFMKQLTVVAVSTITYLKNAFPEDSYMVESFGGVKLRILKKKCRDELAQFLSTALVQAFEAFDKKYLHQLALCFYEDECKQENLIEYHIFEYAYNDDGVTMNVHSKNRDNVKQSTKYTFENVRERTIHLIRACVVIMQACQNDLPSSYDVSLRLYYNEDAPADYQAPGYLSTNETEDHLDPTLSEAIKLGWVETPYHKLIARSYIKEQMRASHEAIPSQNAPVLSNEMDLSGSGVRSENETQLVCPCNKYDDRESYNSSELLTCYYCNTQQHAACYGVRRGGASARHCCAPCHDRDATRAPTDLKLAPLNSKKRECLCIFRRTLELCTELPAIEVRNLTERFRISDANAMKLMKLLHSHGIIKQDPDFDMHTSQKIIPEQLDAVMSKFFNTREVNIVDRLLAETFESQVSVPDPIGEVLSPLEKVSLQNTSYIGRVIENPGMNIPPNEDSTLKQYSEAVRSNDRVEEPSTNPVEVFKKSGKRKLNDGDRPVLRTGVRTKRARTIPK